MVLNKKEKTVMSVIYKLATVKNGQCLLSPLEILERIPYKDNFTESDLEKVLKDLELDGMFEVEQAKKKGDLVYFITLKEAGLTYFRDRQKEKKKLILRIATCVGLAILGWCIKLLLTRFAG